MSISLAPFKNGWIVTWVKLAGKWIDSSIHCKITCNQVYLSPVFYAHTIYKYIVFHWSWFQKEAVLMWYSSTRTKRKIDTITSRHAQRWAHRTAESSFRIESYLPFWLYRNTCVHCCQYITVIIGINRSQYLTKCILVRLVCVCARARVFIQFILNDRRRARAHTHTHTHTHKSVRLRRPAAIHHHFICLNWMPSGPLIHPISALTNSCFSTHRRTTHKHTLCPKLDFLLLSLCLLTLFLPFCGEGVGERRWWSSRAVYQMEGNGVRPALILSILSFLPSRE